MTAQPAPSAPAMPPSAVWLDAALDVDHGGSPEARAAVVAYLRGLEPTIPSLADPRAVVMLGRALGCLGTVAEVADAVRVFARDLQSGRRDCLPRLLDLHGQMMALRA